MTAPHTATIFTDDEMTRGMGKALAAHTGVGEPSTPPNRHARRLQFAAWRRTPVFALVYPSVHHGRKRRNLCRRRCVLKG